MFITSIYADIPVNLKGGNLLLLMIFFVVGKLKLNWNPKKISKKWKQNRISVTICLDTRRNTCCILLYLNHFQCCSMIWWDPIWSSNQNIWFFFCFVLFFISAAAFNFSFFTKKKIEIEQSSKSKGKRQTRVKWERLFSRFCFDILMLIQHCIF